MSNNHRIIRRGVDITPMGNIPIIRPPGPPPPPAVKTPLCPECGVTMTDGIPEIVGSHYRCAAHGLYKGERMTLNGPGGQKHLPPYLIKCFEWVEAPEDVKT